jgi:hypothetical protein
MTNSSWMMTGLIIVYISIALMAAYEWNWPRMLYWISAGCITISVLWMGVFKS